MSLIESLAEQHSMTQARYQKLMSSDKMMEKVKGELDKLVTLGDLVEPEDVVKSAGRLVAGGLGAVPMAGMLAEMPDNSQALQQWLAQHSEQVGKRIDAIKPALAVARHEMGVSATRLLAGVSSIPGASAQVGDSNGPGIPNALAAPPGNSPSSQSNPLAPGA